MQSSLPPIDSIQAEFNNERQRGKHFRVDIDEKIRKKYHKANLGKSEIDKNRRRNFGNKNVGIGAILDRTDVSESAEDTIEVVKLDNSFDVNKLKKPVQANGKSYKNNYYPNGNACIIINSYFTHKKLLKISQYSKADHKES